MFGVVWLGSDLTPDVVQSSTSPDGTWIVEVLDTSGGAGGHSSLSITAKPTRGGDRTEVLSLDPLRDYEVTWADNDRLTIQWESSTSVLVGGIRVTLPPPLRPKAAEAGPSPIPPLVH